MQASAGTNADERGHECRQALARLQGGGWARLQAGDGRDLWAGGGRECRRGAGANCRREGRRECRRETGAICGREAGVYAGGKGAGANAGGCGRECRRGTKIEAQERRTTVLAKERWMIGAVGRAVQGMMLIGAGEHNCQGTMRRIKKKQWELDAPRREKVWKKQLMACQ